MNGEQAEPAITPLLCAGCHAPVALGRDATARCAYCKAETKIPDAYEALQRANQAFAENRKLAADLYDELGAPPGWLLRTSVAKPARSRNAAGFIMLFLVAVQVPYVSVPLLLVIAYGLGYPVSLAIRGIDRLMGMPAGYDYPLSPYLILALTFGLLVPLIAVPLVRIARLRELVDVRIAVQASLAAKPPSHPGGPSGCRNCGAALDLAPGALGVPCVYCKVDNLIALPRAWVDTIQAREFTHFRSIDTALDAFREANVKARERIWKTLFWLVVAFPLIMGVAAIMVALEIAF